LLALVAVGCGDPKSITVTRTETVTSPAPGLPAAVALTHSRLLAAAESGDYARLRPLVPARGFAFSYGASSGGPIEYWLNLERTTDQKPIAILGSILRMPYTLNRGIYVWPFAYDKRKSDLSAYDRKLLGPALLKSYVGEDYYGWRAGIEPDGSWSFFISGD
jgi:hypothetical protein